MPQMSRLLLILYLCVRNRSVTYRTPVDHSCALIYIAFLMHLAENLRDSLIAALIHCKTLSVPVTRRTKLLELADNSAAVLPLPVPGALQKLLPAKIMLINALFLELLNNLDLRRNTRMIRSRLPKRIISLHSLKPNQNILHCVVKRMSHMKLPRNIGGRNNNCKRFFAFVNLCMKILLVKPFLINSILKTMRVISLSQFFTHTFTPLLPVLQR